MFIVQKLIWFIFGTKRATLLAETQSNADDNVAAQPRRMAALLNVGATDNVHQLPRNGVSRAWMKASQQHGSVASLTAETHRASSGTAAPGFARQDHANHRRLTALR